MFLKSYKNKNNKDELGSQNLVSSQSLKEIKKTLNEIIIIAKNKKIPSGFVISTTTKKSDEKVVLLPTRITNYGIFACVTVYTANLAIKLTKLVDGKVDFILVDSEVKLKDFENIINQIKKVTKISKIFSFKNNDMTVDAAYALISNLLDNNFNKRISIVGAGNIGSKLALKFVESGANVSVTSSTMAKTKAVADAINTIKPKNCKSKAIPKTISKIAQNADVIIGLTSGIPVINLEIVNSMRRNGLIIDGGIGTLDKKVVEKAKKKGVKVLRIDVQPSFSSKISLVLETQKFLESTYGNRTYKGIHIVAGGSYGSYGDVVVDKIKKPSKIIGFADGNGGILRKRIPPKFNNKLKIVKELISN